MHSQLSAAAARPEPPETQTHFYRQAVHLPLRHRVTLAEPATQTQGVQGSARVPLGGGNDLHGVLNTEQVDTGDRPMQDTPRWEHPAQSRVQPVSAAAGHHPQPRVGPQAGVQKLQGH